VLIFFFVSEIDFDLGHFLSHCMNDTYNIWHTCGLKACSNSR